MHKSSKVAQKLTGIKAKLYNKKRYSEKAQMKKTITIVPNGTAASEW